MNIKTGLEELARLIERLRATSSNKTKAQILKSSLQAVPALRDYIQAAYDPYRQFHLSSDVAMDWFGAVSESIGDHGVRAFWELIHVLENRSLTGHKAQKAWCAMIFRLGSKPAQEAANAVLDKDLKCRLGIKTVNKVLKDLSLPLVPTFEIALGEPWTGQPVWKDTDESWYASRKLDGIRCLAFLSRGKAPVLLSRSGNTFFTLGTLTTVLSSYHGPDVVLDGELALINDRGEDDFQGIMKEIHRKGHDIANVVYHVFDLIPLDEFDAMAGDTPYRIRQSRLIKTVAALSSQHVARVMQRKVTSKEMFTELMAEVETNGWEGLILRKATPYLGERSEDILKVKKMHDLEARVIRIETGPFEVVENGRSETIRTMTAAVILLEGNEVNVGSGWSLKQRKHYFWAPEQLVGKVITVQYFEKTTNQEGKLSLRFPVVKAVHGDKRTT